MTQSTTEMVIVAWKESIPGTTKTSAAIIDLFASLRTFN